MFTRVLLFVLLCFFTSLSIAAEPQAKRITGIYSNLAYNQEGGDLLGMELVIIPSGQGPELAYVAFVQIAEGGAPFSAVVPIKLVGRQIEFTMPPGGEYSQQHFVGKFDGVDLVVHWSQGTEEHLKRGKSYWQ